ncbi:hypothetical protein [Paenibacillus peoriae]|uniref:hypothetical protein n=1 Tax=Paenibacillus peoriae TaxID=59893 RepID=UPI0012D8A681|nr:hypothetical protein [Paenibacillus peoriae]
MDLLPDLDRKGILEIWGTDDVGEWKESHRCKENDVDSWLDYHDHEYEGFTFRRVNR